MCCILIGLQLSRRNLEILVKCVAGCAYFAALSLLSVVMTSLVPGVVRCKHGCDMELFTLDRTSKALVCDHECCIRLLGAEGATRAWHCSGTSTDGAGEKHDYDACFQCGEQLTNAAAGDQQMEGVIVASSPPASSPPSDVCTFTFLRVYLYVHTAYTCMRNTQGPWCSVFRRVPRGCSTSIFTSVCYAVP